MRLAWIAIGYTFLFLIFGALNRQSVPEGDSLLFAAFAIRSALLVLFGMLRPTTDVIIWKRNFPVVLGTRLGVLLVVFDESR